MKKFFSLIAAVLFAGSMMAETVTLTMEDYAATEFTTTSGISVVTAKNNGSTAPTYNTTGKDLRVYAKGSITISATQNITAISFAISAQGKKRLAPLTVNVGNVAVAGDPDFTATWSGSATSVTFTVGDKADYGTDGNTKAGQLDFTAITITLDGEGGGDNPGSDTTVVPVDTVVTTVSCAAVYSMAKNDVVDLLNDVVVTYANGKNVWVKDATASLLIFLPANSTAYKAGDVLSGIAGVVDIYNGVTEIKPTAAQVEAITITPGEAPAAIELAVVGAADVNKYIVMKGVAVEGTFAEGTASNITIANGEGTIVLRNNFKNGFAFDATKTYDIYAVVTIYQNNPQLYFITAEEAGGTTPVDPETPTTCAEAAAAALSVENNNDLYNDGAVYSITGYVTSIQTAYNSQYNNISFWMADAADGGNVLEAYRAACASAEDAPIVGDKVTVTGSLTKYNTTPEFAAGCTYVIVEHATPAVPQNLGVKTIAEFLALANTVDTCVITGVVANIKKNNDGSYNKYGNFDLVDGDASVYVYGLLTADGQAQQFQSMSVDEGDTLTVKAVYMLYNNAPQAKNAVFVAVKKAVVEPGETIALEFEDGWVDNQYFEDYGATDLVLYNIPLDPETYAFVGDGQYLNLDFYPEDANDISGTYTIADETLDAEYTYMMVVNGTDTAEVAFTAGEVTFNVLAKSEEQMAAQIAIAAELTGDDGNIYTINGTFVLYYQFLSVETDVENVATEQKAIKRIEMGNIIIEKNGVKYSVNGQIVK